MSRKPYDQLPWWCQLLWPWFGPPWYEQVEDLDAISPRTGALCICQRPNWLSCWLAMTRQVRATWPKQHG